MNFYWDGDKVYYEVCKIVGVEMQYIIYIEWFFKIFGFRGMVFVGIYSGYELNIDVGIVNVFVIVVFRFGYGFINLIIFCFNFLF